MQSEEGGEFVCGVASVGEGCQLGEGGRRRGTYACARRTPSEVGDLATKGIGDGCQEMKVRLIAGW